MVGSAMTGGDIKEGIIFGAATGLVGGGFQGYCSAKNQGLNPWTGAKLPETTVITRLECILTVKFFTDAFIK